MADITYPNTSLTITFEVEGGAEKIYQLSAEVNAEDNNGKTKFTFGDTVFYRVYKSTNVASMLVFTSDGSEALVSSSLYTIIEDEIVVFSGSSEANTTKPMISLISATAMGHSALGSISANGQVGVRCSKESSGPLDPVVGVYKVTYRSLYSLRKLYNVPQPVGFGIGDFTSYPVLVYIVGVPSTT
jgi:hypothetical protein